MDPDSSSSRRRRAGGSTLLVTVTDGRGRAIADGGLARWLARVAPSRLRGEVAIALVSDAHIRRLNKQYRRKDKATDVLSFPSAGPASPSREPRAASRELGDIAIATGVARRQAKAAGHSYQTELRVLALHGLLHLLGYDHEDPADDGRMARVEARLRRKGGIPQGLIARAQKPSARASGRSKAQREPSARASGRRVAPPRGARERERVGVGPHAQRKR